MMESKLSYTEYFKDITYELSNNLETLGGILLMDINCKANSLVYGYFEVPMYLPSRQGNHGSWTVPSIFTYLQPNFK